MIRLSLFLMTVLAATADPPMAGRRIDLGEASLFVPDGYQPVRGQVDVVLHLHGAASVVERAIVQSKPRSVLILFNRKGLSSVYAGPFSDPGLFTRLLAKTLAALKGEGLVKDPHLGQVVVSSFSAGFGGVREILGVPEHFARINGLILADSLYAGYLGDPARRQIDPAKMANFRRFAAEAAAGRKFMVVTHSAQVPAGYASTTETADDLIRSVGGKPAAAVEEWSQDWHLTRRTARGGFLVLGFAGTGPEDHMRHLRNIGLIFRAAPTPGTPGASSH